MTTPNTIRELFHALNTSKVDGGAGVKECYDLVFNSSNETAMKLFWTEIGKVCSVENQNIPKDPFVTLINAQDSSIKIEGIEKKCKDVIVDNLLSGGEINNPTKQNQLKRIMEPFFSPPTKHNTDLNQKNIITAFIGVHRDTPENKILIKALNK
jgi:hypothetical protein